MKMLKLSNFLQAEFNIFLYTIFGWRLIRFYMHLLCKIYFIFNKKERVSIKKSVSNAIGMVDKKKNLPALLRNVFSGIFFHYYEKIYISFEERSKIADFMSRNILCSDIDVIKKAVSKGRGVILITGHYGAIEFIPLLLGMKSIETSMIAKFKTPKIKKMGFKQASNFGVRMIDGDEKGSVLKKAIKELKKNRVVITQCDEIDEWRPSVKRKTVFLGRVTGLDRTINLLCKRSGAEVVFCILHRFSLSKYRFAAYSHEQMMGIIENCPSVTTGEMVLKVLEQFIYKYPEQWYEWKKYPDIGDAHNPINRWDKPVPVPNLKPVFNINL